MFKGYKNYVFYKDKTNKLVNSLAHVNKCIKCQKLNPSMQSPVIHNVQCCLYCGNPFYIIKS